MPDATFTWDLDASHESYEVTYQNITDAGSIIPVTPPLILPPDHSILIENLLPNKEYEFCVKANCIPDGYTPWICQRYTSPNIPSFLIRARAYNPLGDGVPTGAFGGLSVKNSASTAGTDDVSTADPNPSSNTSFRISAVSAYSDNIFRIGYNLNNSVCQALYVWKNGTLIHRRHYNYAGIVTTIFLDLASADTPSTIVSGDEFDFLLVINNDSTVAGDPYVPVEGLGLCGTV